VLDLTDIPMFYTLFNSTTENYKKDNLWILNMLQCGLHDKQDFSIFQRRHAFTLITSFVDSSLADLRARKISLDIIRRGILINFHSLLSIGIITWLQQRIINLIEHMKQEVGRPNNDYIKDLIIATTKPLGSIIEILNNSDESTVRNCIRSLELFQVTVIQLILIIENQYFDEVTINLCMSFIRFLISNHNSSKFIDIYHVNALVSKFNDIKNDKLYHSYLYDILMQFDFRTRRNCLNDIDISIITAILNWMITYNLYKKLDPSPLLNWLLNLLYYNNTLKDPIFKTNIPSFLKYFYNDKRIENLLNKIFVLWIHSFTEEKQNKIKETNEDEVIANIIKTIDV